MRVLLMGFTDTVLEALDRSLPARSVTLLEEPDVWEGRALAAKAQAHPCFRDVCLARYQQDEHYLSVLEGLGRIDAVAPGAEYAVTAAAQAAEVLGLAGAGVKAAATLRSKLLLRAATQDSGMRTPRFTEIRSARDVDEFAGGRPCVVKPAERQASLGVVLLDAGDDPSAAWRECTQADEGNQIAQRPMSWRYMAEDRLYGPEFSTECLVQDGLLVFLNVTRQHSWPGARPVEIGHVVPGVPAHELPRWETAVRDLIAATGFATGMLHAEWIQDETGPVLVECAGRPPGDRLTDLIDVVYGGNLIDSWVRLLSGRAARPDAVPAGAAAIHYLVPGPGTIRSIDGADRAREVRGVHRVKLLRAPGDVIGEVKSSWDRVGYVMASGRTVPQAEAIARTAASMITVRMSRGCDSPGSDGEVIRSDETL